MRIGGGGPPRIIQQPAPATQTDKVDDAGDAEGGGKKAAATQGAQAKEPSAKGMVSAGFGITPDQTDDINPITTNKNRSEGGKEALDGIKMPKGAEGVGDLPSEKGVGDVDPFQAMEQAFDAAAADMDRGMKAQKAMGKRGAAEEEEEIEDPSDVAATGEPGAPGDPSDSWDNWDTGMGAKGLDPANPADAMKMDLDHQLTHSRVNGVGEMHIHLGDKREDQA